MCRQRDRLMEAFRVMVQGRSRGVFFVFPHLSKIVLKYFGHALILEGDI
jgi:hypothetical protein